MNALGERIARLIQVQGPISVAQFISMALHDPKHGYYATRDPIGAAGDFITAPEISQIFGELLGAWVVRAWCDQGAPSPARLVELGPGGGTLICDVLRAARIEPKFLSSIEIVLVETSARLRRAQSEKLGNSQASVRWLQRFDDALSDRPLFLLANEFFDALPIRQFVFAERGWCERMVGLDGGHSLAFALSPFLAPLDIPAERGKPCRGNIYETCPSGEAVMEQLAGGIAQHGGAALIVDYGYGADAAFGETLQAVAGHRYANVLENPGEADLSAHVDFAALARAAERAGAKVYGPVAQGTLLERLGIYVRAERLAGDNPKQADEIAAAVDRLISPEQMGTLFKALAILPKGAARPPGFG